MFFYLFCKNYFAYIDEWSVCPKCVNKKHCTYSYIYSRGIIDNKYLM